MRFDQALPCSIDMVIPGYEKSYPPGIFKALAFSPLDSKSWYQQFAAKLEGSIGKGFLPLTGWEMANTNSAWYTESV